MAASFLLFALAPIFRRADVVSRAPPEPRGAVQWRSMATLAAAFCATPAIAATLTPKPVREALAARFSRAFRRLRHGQTIAAYPAAFASILDEEAKAERADATVWDTAVRECREECGIDLSDHLLSPHDEVLPLKKRDGETFGVVFVVESYQKPKMTGDKRILRHRLVRGTMDINALHPRLRFACGMQSKIRALAAQ